MTRLRTILILLLCLTLPYSAVAGVLGQPHCRHDAAAPAGHGGMQHQHGAMQHGAADPSGCDCAVKCDCQHHCAGIGAGAVLPVIAGVDLSDGGARVAAGFYQPFIPATLGRSLFRPPIAAPSGAA